MGILSMMAAYYVQGDQSQRILAAEADRLYTVLQGAEDDAQMYDDTLGVDISDKSYRLMRYDDEDGWQPVEEDGQAREYEVADRIRLIVDRNKDQSRAVVSFLQKKQPAAVFYSSGDSSPFRITLQWEDAALPRYVICFNKDHMLTLEEQRHE